MKYKKISCKELTGNVFTEIGDRWLLITVYDKEKKRINVMTASWGAVGILWGKSICTVFVRHSRYTERLLKTADTLSAVFLKDGPEMRRAYGICGKQSGRDTDKVEACGLTPADIDGYPALEEARTVFTLRKLYTDEIKEERFVDRSLLSNYAGGDFHEVFVCEITGVYMPE